MSQLSITNFGRALSDLTSKQISVTIEQMSMQFNQSISDTIMEAGLIGIGGIASSAVSLHGLLGSHIGKANHETTVSHHDDGGFSIHERIHFDEALPSIHSGLNDNINLEAEKEASDAQSLLNAMGHEMAIEIPLFANQLPLKTLSLLEAPLLPDPSTISLI